MADSFTDFLAIVDIRAFSRWFFLASPFFCTLGVFVCAYHYFLSTSYASNFLVAIAMTKQLLKSINCGQENTTSSNNKSKSLNFMPVSVVIIYVRSYTLLCNSYRDIHCNYGYTLEVISLYFSYL